MLKIPNYKIDKELGAGGMSTVYLATHTILDRQVALKIMSPSYLSNEGFKDCFINEGKIISKLNHPHIVHIYDIGISNDACYMAIELLEDDTLRQKIDSKTLSFEEIEKIVTQVASALSAAHSQKFIHRDIKPRNILFRKNGEAVLTDFGISKIQNTEGDLTSLGYIAGTPAYMPPEFSMGEELDHRGDIYSLGIVFYEMLTGKKPYQAKTAAAISYEHVNSPIPRLSSSLVHYQAIIDRALAKKPQNRFDTAMEFASAVKVANNSFDATVISTRSDIADSPTVIFTHPNTLLAQGDKAAKSTLRLFIIGGLLTLLLLISTGTYLNYFNITKMDIEPVFITAETPTTSSNILKENISYKETTTPNTNLNASNIISKPGEYPKLPDIPPLENLDKNLPFASINSPAKELKKPKDGNTLIVENVIPNNSFQSDEKLPNLPSPNIISATKEPALRKNSTSINEDKPKETTIHLINASTRKPILNILSNEQKIIIASLLDNCFIRATSAIKEHIRITKNKTIIKDIQNLKMDSGRTKFITDTQRQMQISQVRFDDNISIYYKNLTKLKAYKEKDVQDQLTVTKTELSNKQINQDISDILTKHFLKINTEKLTLEACKEDFAKYANNILNSF